MISASDIEASGLKPKLERWWKATEERLNQAKLNDDHARCFYVRGTMETRRHPSTMIGLISKEVFRHLVGRENSYKDPLPRMSPRSQIYVISDNRCFLLTDDLTYGGPYFFPNQYQSRWHLEVYKWDEVLKMEMSASGSFLRLQGEWKRQLDTAQEIANYLNERQALK